MDSVRQINMVRNRGVAAIFVAAMLLFFLLTFFVVLDFVRMYYVRGQLQNAADAAALAGMDKIIDSTDTTQLAARQEAWKFACKNTAAGDKVFLVQAGSGNCDTPPASGLNESNDPNGDITVGHWDGSNYLAGALPVNAMKIHPQRAAGLESSGRGPVAFIFQNIGQSIGWTRMDVKSLAIAGKPPLASMYNAICWDDTSLGLNGACYSATLGRYCTKDNPCPLTPARVFNSGPTPPMSDLVAWTSLTTSPTSASGVSSYLCGDQPFQDVCGKAIFTTMGTDSSTWSDLQALMFNPLYDSGNKTCPGNDNLCDSSSDAVTGWWVIVPITQQCPPGTNSVVPIYGYARMHVIAICAPGGGTTCRSYNSAARDAACATYGSGDKIIAVDSIACVDCANSTDLPGTKSVLVK